LVYQVSEGWEPLCAFLGVAVPEAKPFPHLNDAAEFRARVERGVRAIRTIEYVALGVIALAMVSLVMLAIRLGS
jgi:Sulfotransferase domain